MNQKIDGGIIRAVVAKPEALTKLTRMEFALLAITAMWSASVFVAAVATFV